MVGHVQNHASTYAFGGNEDIVYYVNGYEINNFIKEGLGLLLLEKSDKPAERDTLGTVTVIVSA
jgi:hypothetical protein